MRNLINITQNAGEQIVSARELYAFLEVKADFTTWCKRMFAYGFEIDLDYSLLKIGERSVHNKIDYALTLDCAKEISMLQRSDKGKQARLYFIKMEKKVKNLSIDAILDNPDFGIKLLTDYKTEKEARVKAEQQVLAMQPKVDLMNKVLDTDKLIDIGQAAKILNLPFGRNTVFKKLREAGILFKTKNEPKQVYIQKQYFVLKERFIERSSSESFVVIKVLVTQKGLEFLSRVFDNVVPQKELLLIK